jgi:hypothetical protein
MKLCTTTAGTGLGALLRVIGCGAVTVFASAAISACTSTPTSSASSTDTAGATQTTSAPVSLPANENSTPSNETPTQTNQTPTQTNQTPTQTPAAAPTSTPTVAPATGGGGTAGIQDATLFIIGGAAVVAGAGGIAYHRRATRNR